MSLMYEGVDVDKPVAGFSGAPQVAVRANNIITIANERIRYYTGIADAYNKAYSAFAAFKTNNPDPRAKGYDAASYTRLLNALDTLKNQVIKAGGSLKSAGASGGGIGDAGQAEANFSSKINKYNQDIFKYQQVLENFKNANIQICLPSPDLVRASIIKDAAAANAAAVAQAKAQDKIVFDYNNSIKALSDPNNPNMKDISTPGNISSVLNSGLEAGIVVWDANTLALAAATVTGGTLLEPSDLVKLAREIPKGATLDKVKAILINASKSVKARSVPKAASTKNAALKPSQAVINRTNPPRR